MNILIKLEYRTVADPGFPSLGYANPLVWDKNLLLDTIFGKNCMKIKEIGPRGGHVPI